MTTQTHTGYYGLWETVDEPVRTEVEVSQRFGCIEAVKRTQSDFMPAGEVCFRINLLDISCEVQLGAKDSSIRRWAPATLTVRADKSIVLRYDAVTMTGKLQPMCSIFRPVGA